MKNKKGSALVFSLIILSIMLVVAVGSFSTSVTDQIASMDTGKSVAAFQAADAGVEKVFEVINYEIENGGTLKTLTEAGLCNLGVSYVDSTSFAGKKITVDFYKYGNVPVVDCDTVLIEDLDSVRSTGEFGGTVRAVSVSVKKDSLKIMTATLPTGRQNMSCTLATNDKIYCFGGYDGVYLDDILEYDPDNDTLNKKNSPEVLPTGRQNLSCVGAPNGKIYCIGGVRTAGATTYYDEVLEYDPQAGGAPVLVANLPQGRAGHSCTLSTNGKIYCIGGANGLLAFTRKIIEFDPVTKNVNEKLELSDGIIYHSCVPYTNGKINCFGGAGLANGVYFNQIFEYNSLTNQRAVKGGTLASGRDKISCASLFNGKNYCFGGWNGNEMDNIAVYDPVDDVSIDSSTTSLPEKTVGIACTSSDNGRIYCFGGWSNVSKNWILRYTSI